MELLDGPDELKVIENKLITKYTYGDFEYLILDIVKSNKKNLGLKVLFLSFHFKTDDDDIIKDIIDYAYEEDFLILIQAGNEDHDLIENKEGIPFNCEGVIVCGKSDQSNFFTVLPEGVRFVSAEASTVANFAIKTGLIDRNEVIQKITETF